MEAIPILIILLFVLGVPEVWLIVQCVRLIKRKRPLSLALGVMLGIGALLWPLALVGGLAVLIVGSITVAR